MLNLRRIQNLLIPCLLGLLFFPVASIQAIDWGIPKTSDNRQQPFPGKEYHDLIAGHDHAFYIGSPEGKDIYLTFNMGFDNGTIPQILEALKAHDVPATFFLNGRVYETNPEAVKQILEAGHTVGNHTYYHINLAKANKAKFQEDLEKLEQAHLQVTGQPISNYLSPPSGSFTKDTLEWAKERGYYTFLWSLTYLDFDVNKQKGAQYAFDQITSRIHPGALILIHATSTDNAACLEKLLPKLKQDGYTFQPLGHLIESKGEGAQ
ncbi:MAG: polysaccharide deacetylase family protein [Turicibacter sp.]|nr:polysaccharide deacetylase family protein [Turicibacter sp.]